MVMNRHGEIVIVDATGRERERHHLMYGATLKVKDGEHEAQGLPAGRVGPVHSVPILTEVAGMVRFADLIENVTSKRRWTTHGPLAQGGDRVARTRRSARASRSATR